MNNKYNFETINGIYGNSVDEEDIHRDLIKQCSVGGVEIGILYGHTTRILCEGNPNIPIYGIDPIIPDSMNANVLGDRKRIQANMANCNNFTFYNDYSFNVIRHFHKPFDYLFIDADHRYEFVKQDFDDWYPKLALGGYLLLHDSAANRGGPHHWEGPSRLADELIVEQKLSYLITVYCLTAFQKVEE